jgi:hypothetical protein
MKILPKILILNFVLSMSCQRSATTSDKERLGQQVQDQTLIANSQLDKQKQDKNKEIASIQKRENNLDAEFRALLESTKIIIQNNQKIPTFEMYVDSNSFESLRNHYLKVECTKNEFMNLIEFNIDFNETYLNSSNRTGLTDGTLFCIKPFIETESELSKILYGRSEGGHTSDKMQLITSNHQLKQIYILPLSYQTGWDGHETVVKSKIRANIIIREITERYGWSSMHPDSLDKQPRRVVTQKIKVNKSGKMEVIKEEVKKYNIDKLFD